MLNIITGRQKELAVRAGEVGKGRGEKSGVEMSKAEKNMVELDWREGFDEEG